MTEKLTECGQVRDLLALRVSEDLNLDEAERVDQHVRYCDHCRNKLSSLGRTVGLLRDVGAAPTAVDQNKSLWDRLEPRLGPAGRLRRRRLSRISTPQLAFACAAMIALVAYFEMVVPSVAQPTPLARRAPNTSRIAVGGQQFASQIPDAVIRPMLGVAVQEVDTALARRLGIREDAGAVIAHVLPGSAADQAGLQSADVILAVEGTSIQSPQHFANLIGSFRIGTRLLMQIFRDGRIIEREVMLGAQRSSVDPPAQKSKVPDFQQWNWTLSQECIAENEALSTGDLA